MTPAVLQLANAVLFTAEPIRGVRVIRGKLNALLTTVFRRNSALTPTTPYRESG